MSSFWVETTIVWLGAFLPITLLAAYVATQSGPGGGFASGAYALGFAVIVGASPLASRMVAWYAFQVRMPLQAVDGDPGLGQAEVRRLVRPRRSVFAWRTSLDLTDWVIGLAALRDGMPMTTVGPAVMTRMRETSWGERRNEAVSNIRAGRTHRLAGLALAFFGMVAVLVAWVIGIARGWYTLDASWVWLLLAVGALVFAGARSMVLDHAYRLIVARRLLDGLDMPPPSA